MKQRLVLHVDLMRILTRLRSEAPVRAMPNVKAPKQGALLTCAYDADRLMEELNDAAYDAGEET